MAEALGREQRRRLSLARLQELEPAVSRDRLLAAALEEVRELAADMHARMEQASARLRELLDAQNSAAQEGSQLAHELGERRNDLRPVDLAALNEWLSPRAAALYPQRKFTPHRLLAPVVGPVRFAVDFYNDHDSSVVARVSAASYLAPEHGS